MAFSKTSERCLRGLLIAGSIVALSSVAFAQPATNIRLDAVNIGGETVVAGRLLRFSVDVGVEGPAAASPVEWRISLSADGTFTGTVALSAVAPLDLSTEGARRIEADVVVPANIAGRFFLMAELDVPDDIVESNEFDNRRASATRVQVRPAQPDFRLGAITLTPTQVTAGQAVAASVDVRNAGDAAASAVVVTYLSVDDVVSTADVELVRQTIPLEPRQTRTVDLSGIVPVDAPAGPYFLGVQVDPDGTVVELIENNNGGVSERSFTVLRTDLTLETSRLPDAALTVAYSARLSARGGDGQYAFSVDSGALPPGLRLSAAGVISGEPVETGAFDFTIRVGSGGLFDNESYRVTVTGLGLPLEIAWDEPAPAFLGLPYEQILVAGGGEAPYRWRLLAGAVLPPGIVLSEEGVLSGVPDDYGVFTFGLEVEDRLGAAVQTELTIDVTSAQAVLIGQADLQPVPVGAMADIELSVIGGIPPYRWEALTPPPPGLTLTLDGRFSGTPTQVGLWPVRVRVTDGKRRSSSDDAVVRVLVEPAGAFDVTSPALPPGQVNALYDAVIEVSGGQLPYTWRLVPGTSLPPGIVLEFPEGDEPLNTVRLFGRPQTVGAQPFSLRVDDDQGRRLEIPLAINVAPAPNSTAGEGCRCVGGRARMPVTISGILVVLAGLLSLRRRW